MRLQYRMKCANQFVSSRRRYEITSVATGLNRTETLQIAAINATAANEREAKLAALTAQLDSGLAIRLDIIARMREDGRATGSALAARSLALPTIISECGSIMRRKPSLAPDGNRTRNFV